MSTTGAACAGLLIGAVLTHYLPNLWLVPVVFALAFSVPLTLVSARSDAQREEPPAGDGDPSD